VSVVEDSFTPLISTENIRVLRTIFGKLRMWATRSANISDMRTIVLRFMAIQSWRQGEGRQPCQQKADAYGWRRTSADTSELRAEEAHSQNPLGELDFFIGLV
jgi:hypothetical protein